METGSPSSKSLPQLTEAWFYWFHVDLKALPGAHPVVGGAVPMRYVVGPSI